VDSFASYKSFSDTGIWSRESIIGSTAAIFELVPALMQRIEKPLVQILFL
jgi:hypothetical protein